MQHKRCLTALGILRRRVLGYRSWRAALTIVIATLTLANGAAGSDLGGASDKAGAYNVLHLFTWAKYPSGDLVFDAAGNLYGTTLNGGSAKCGFGCGVVYKLARTPRGTWTVSILHAFTGEDGANPNAGLILDAGGNLYGTTSLGGSACAGLGCGVRVQAQAQCGWELDGERSPPLYRRGRSASPGRPALRLDRQSLRHSR
jgi:hypothetical protein